mgnify:FL=1|jgi:hypothetical protein
MYPGIFLLDTSSTTTTNGAFFIRGQQEHVVRMPLLRDVHLNASVHNDLDPARLRR